MPRPCNHNTILEPDLPYKPGDCRICWLYFNDYEYREKWDIEEGGQAKSPVHFRDTGNHNCNCGNKEPKASRPKLF
jgi:hypothetical protein